MTRGRVLKTQCEKQDSPIQINSPPAGSLLTVGDGGSHGRVWNHGLPGVVDGHTWHLLPCGGDEYLLRARRPALLYAHIRTHTHAQKFKRLQ